MFFWGSATSAHQVEGGNKNDFSVGGLDAGRACDSYNRYEEDFDIAKSLGQNVHRFSIEWSRIEPEEGKFDEKEIEHYRRVLTALRVRGLEPFVTLWHFTNPIWFAEKGGWTNKKASAMFARYVKYVVKSLVNPDTKRELAPSAPTQSDSRYGVGVKYWIVLNEPEVYADMGYWRGKWPPYRKNPFAALKVLRNLRVAHKAAYEVIKKEQPEVQVGIASNFVASSPLGRWIINFPVRRTLDQLKNHLDFIGLNYYLWVDFLANKNLPKSDLGWEIYPRGVYENILAFKKYNKPIYITENGVADASDSRRGDFIKDHVSYMKRAMEEGADVRGYFHWSLLDNYEWHKGLGARFGLVEVNYETMERKIRPSAHFYAEEIKKN